MQLQVRYNVR